MTYTGTQEQLAAMFDEMAENAKQVQENADKVAVAMRAKGERYAYQDAAAIVRAWKQTA